MECLTAKECRRRIDGRGMLYAPHPHQVACTAQLRLPATSPERASVGGRLAPLVERESSVLLVVDDWGLYKQEEMAQLDAIRTAVGEMRTLIEAPGHLLRKPEHALFTDLTSLILGFPSRWSFYLYGLSSEFTLYFWEGDFLDVWSSKGVVSELRELLG
jgi:hypothetical protein